MTTIGGLKATQPDVSAVAVDRSLLSGLFWTAGAKWGSQVLSWGSTLLVARLLTPVDFGVLGTAMLVMGFLTLLSDLGLGAAVIQNQALDSTSLARLAGLSIAASCVLAGIAAGMSVPMASFFEQPALVDAIIVMSSSLVLAGFQVVPRSLLARALRFRTLAKIDASESVSAAATTLTFAIFGFGFWSLIFGNLTGKSVATALVLLQQRQRISAPGRLSELRKEIRFGAHQLLATIGWYVYGGADLGVVSRVLGTGAAGSYSLALNIATAPISLVTSMVSRVAPGVFSAVQTNRAHLHRYLYALVEVQALLVFPAALGLAMIAPDLVSVVLGPRWNASILPLQLLAVCTAFRCVSPVLVQALVFSGYPAVNSRITLQAAVVLPVIFFIGSAWGVAGVAAGWLVGYLGFVLPKTVVASKRHLGTSHARIAVSLLPATICSASMLCGLFIVFREMEATAPSVGRLALFVLLGVLIYISSVLLFFGRRVRAYIDVVRKLKQ